MIGTAGGGRRIYECHMRLQSAPKGTTKENMEISIIVDIIFILEIYTVSM